MSYVENDMRIKTCNNGHDKPCIEFNKSKSGKFGRHPFCKVCRKEKNAKNNHPRPLKGTIVNCNKCLYNLDELLFSTCKGNLNGLQNNCKNCQSEVQCVYNSTMDAFIKKKILDVRNNAKKRKMTVNLSYNDIFNRYQQQEGKCNLSGITMTHISTRGNNHTMKHKYNMSVDRIDSDDKFYNPDNIQMVCAVINRMKWDFPQDIFVNILAQIKFNDVDYYEFLESEGL